MTAQTRGDVIVATEHIKAPPEIVFPYFTDPVLIARWLCDSAELDARPGGAFLLDMGQVAAHGTFVTVEAPYRVVFTWGIPGSSALPPGASTVEVVLTPDGDDTMVVLTHRGLPPDQLERHRAGWAERLARLSAARVTDRPTDRDGGDAAHRPSPPQGPGSSP